MDAQGMPIAGSIALAFIIAAGAVFVMRDRASELRVCQDVLRGLIDGNPRINRSIAWERLRALGVDVGSAYRQLPNEQERSAYQRAFIALFAQGFRRANGQANGFSRWRVQRRAGERVIVAADYEPHHRTLLLTVPASGPKRIESMQWQ